MLVRMSVIVNTTNDRVSGEITSREELLMEFWVVERDDGKCLRAKGDP